MHIFTGHIIPLGWSYFLHSIHIFNVEWAYLPCSLGIFFMYADIYHVAWDNVSLRLGIYGKNQTGRGKAKHLGILPFMYSVFLTT